MSFRYPLTRPAINWKTYLDVFRVLWSGYLTEGPVTKDFERRIAEYVGSSHAVAVCNATVGLEVALRAYGIGPGDEVIVPGYTHPATADVVKLVGATLVIVDISLDTLLIDYEEIEKAITDRTRAVIPVSQFGNPLDYDKLYSIISGRNIKIIEDAACSIGATFRGKKVGSQADISVYSFHPRKFITTGEGGAIVTNDSSTAEWIRSYKAFGVDHIVARGDLEFTETGTNYKLSNILSAVGLSQMRYIDTLLEERMRLGKQYNKLLKDESRISIPVVHESAEHSYQTYSILVENRDIIIKKLREKGIEAQIGTFALNLHPAFSVCDTIRHLGELKNSNYAFKHNLALPLFPGMKFRDQQFIVSQLLSELNP